MPIDIQSEEGQIIRRLIPLSTLPINQFESLCRKVTIEVADASSFLFKTSDTDTDLIYLIDGIITLQSSELKIETIQSGTESSRFALAHQIPRKIDALANTSVRFLRLNAGIIDTLPSNSFEQEKDKNYMVIDEPEDENDADWMTTLLKSPIFRALPPANLQKIIMGLEEVNFKKGMQIVKQGEPGDFYYLIKKGHCLLSRKPSTNAKEIKLAQLRTQDTFGEDSLLSGDPRNVSITALTDISLLRLKKDKFISLIKEPSLKYISHSEIADKLDNGAILLDVRAPDEYNKHHLPNSINAPFFSLRMQLKTLDKRKDILVVCANGKTSEASAFLLLRHKLKALIVEGGIEQDPHGAETSALQTIDESIDQDKTSAPTELKPAATTEVPGNEASSLDSLKNENQQLKQMLTKVTEEKEELEKKYRVLYKQSEKLKAVLDTLKIGGGSK